MNKNYTILHCHSDLSNATTVMDSVTKYTAYIDKAKELGMKAIAISEHGNNFEWCNKYKYCKKNGIKYIHAVEFYITKTIDEKKRDNYHCLLIAKNYDGVKEINKLITKSFNREDGHFYFNPRITFEELCNTSDNIIISSGCLGGMLRDESEVYFDFINFMKKNKHRCYLEIQPHPCSQQLEYNNKLIEIHNKTNIPILVTTDTHSLNKDLAEARIILQKSKNTHFENEDDWNTVFMTYEDILDNFNKQDFKYIDKVLDGLENTNRISDMVEEFELDTSFKYPIIYENPRDTFKKLIKEGLIKRGITLNKKIKDIITNEFQVLEKTMQIDYLLLVYKIINWANSNGIYQGYSRGSISGSYIAYILGITEMDSIKWDLNFFRYASPNRISLADVDLDWYEKDRESVLDYILKDKVGLDNLKTSKIVTFNTINLKGAIRDVGRALNIPLSEVSNICDNIESKESFYRNNESYKELFRYTDLLIGVIVSIGSHPAGAIISDRNIDEEFGLCTLSSTDYQVSCINMKEVDYLGYVKLDILGLDNVGLINETCKMIGIDRLTPDNTNEADENVWNSIADDATLIFQWESIGSSKYLNNMFNKNLISRLKKEDENFSYIDWMSFGNGLIRPACESYRNDVLTGDFYDNGLQEINDFLKSTRGRLSMQEDIMNFLVKFCGYSGGESDNIRRAIGKKENTEKLTPEIESRFIEYTSKTYNISKDKCKEVIKPFIQVIIDASNYSFSWNHAKSYSWIGYIGGYLRYYYPLETLTTALNIFYEKEEKSANIVKYINEKTNIKIRPIKFRYSKSNYFPHKESNSIYKGLSSIKHINQNCANELYDIGLLQINHFIDILDNLKCTNSKQLNILVSLDYFSEFAKPKKLIKFIEKYEKYRNCKTINKEKCEDLDLVKKYCAKETDKQLKEIDNIGILKEIWGNLINEDLPIIDKIKNEIEYLGYATTKDDCDENICIITGINTERSNPMLSLYFLSKGETEVIKIKNKLFNESEIEVFNMIKIMEVSDEFKWMPDGVDKNGKTKFKKGTEKEKILTKFKILS